MLGGTRFLIFAGLIGLTAPASAATVTATDPQSLVKALQGAGYKAELTKDSSGDPMIRSASGGSNFSLLFYGCATNKACKTIQLHAGYDVEEKTRPSLEKINQWNRDKRFAKAYLDKENDPIIEMDVDLEDGGMSSELFIDNVEYWTSSMSDFEKFIDW